MTKVRIKFAAGPTDVRHNTFGSLRDTINTKIMLTLSLNDDNIMKFIIFLQFPTSSSFFQIR